MIKKASNKAALKDYYVLMKPGIIRGNVLVAIAGYLLGAAVFDFSLYALIGMTIGVTLTVASACIANNILDMRIDSRMQRTKQRALVTGAIAPRTATTLSMLLLVLAVIIMAVLTPIITVCAAVFGWVAYVALYGYAKRRGAYGTLVGSISGAMPPVIGYVAASAQLDMTAVGLFAVLVAWQMPHFYAISIYRRDDYASAGIPVLSVASSIATTKQRIVGYIVAFTIVTCAVLFGTGASVFFIVLMGLMGIAWLAYAVAKYNIGDDNKWAKGVFGMSLLALLLFSIGLGIDSVIRIAA